MKALALVLSVALVSAGYGEVYEWKGVDGDWNSSVNWDPSGTPGAGDVAVFGADAEITSGIVIGSGTLTVSNATGTALHFRGVISGAGGLAKGGAGSIHLHAANTFQGLYTAVGMVDATADKTISSETVAYHGGAFGASGVVLDEQAFSGHGARLTFDGSENPSMTVTVPLSVSGDQASAGNLLFKGGLTDITFKENVSSPCRLAPVYEGATLTGITFEKEVSCPNWINFPAIGYVTQHVHFKGKVTVGGTINVGSYETLHFHSAGNSASVLSTPMKVVMEAEDALPSASLTLRLYSGNYPPFVDLNGFDQTYAVYSTIGWSTQYEYEFGFTSPDDKPAVLHCNGDVMRQPRFCGLFKGAAGLEWNPDASDREFVFSNRVQTTKGAFSVLNGTLCFRNGAGAPNLSKLTVAGTGHLAVEETASSVFAGTIEIADEAVLDLASGVELTCEYLTAYGEDKPTGVYRHADLEVIPEGAAIRVVRLNAWTAATGGRWDDPANWGLKRVPVAGDTVTISGAKTVTVEGSTARLAALALESGVTLVLSNGWDDVVAADLVTLAGSTITIPGAFETDAEKRRVHIVCGDFSMDAASRIDMDAKGWMGGHYQFDGTSNPKTKYKNPDGVDNGGFGPGRVKSDTMAAASHLGQGTSCAVWTSALSSVYDDPLAPVEPGSGGKGLNLSEYGQAGINVPSGGGAVFIEATGAVTVNGRILASGKGAIVHNFWVGHWGESNCAGSGGAVRILAGTFAGSGEIHADGGNGNYSIMLEEQFANGVNATGLPGGGGGVAIVCSSSDQPAGAATGMRISAAAGVYTEGDALTWATIDRYRRASEPGTVYISDPRIISDTIGHGLTGRLVGFRSYTYEGDLDWDYGYVRFGATGVTFTVTGDLSMSGEWSRLDIGGAFVKTHHAVRPYVSAGDEPVALAVGGDLTVAGGAALAVYAAEVPGEATWGADVTVGGAFTVGDGGSVYPVSDYGNGGAPHFTVGSFTLAATGVVNADHCGGSGAWAGGQYSQMDGGQRYSGVGDGAGIFGGAGSHGGLGGRGLGNGSPGNSRSAAGAVCDDPYLPKFSGAGGGSAGYRPAGDGGGVFHLMATGPVRIDGRISADGVPSDETLPTEADCYSSGAGGTICIGGSTVSGAATAVLSARGGDSVSGAANFAAGCGGGGRISLWCGMDLLDKPHRKNPKHRESAADAVFGGRFADWLGAVDVSGGTNVVRGAGTPVPETWGAAGTVWYNGYQPAEGMLLLIR